MATPGSAARYAKELLQTDPQSAPKEAYIKPSSLARGCLLYVAFELRGEPKPELDARVGRILSVGTDSHRRLQVVRFRVMNAGLDFLFFQVSPEGIAIGDQNDIEMIDRLSLWQEARTGDLEDALEGGVIPLRGLAALPSCQREVIVLKIWHQFTFEEIGALLEISPNTAAGRYRYGLQKLKAFFKGDEYERWKNKVCARAAEG